MPRVAWVTGPSGRDERVLTTCADVDIDVSDMVMPEPAIGRVHTAPIDEAALADLLRRSRCP